MAAGARIQVVGFRLGRLLGHLLRHAGGDDFLLLESQHAALEVRHAAARQVVVDHPQHHVVDRREVVVVDGAEGNAMLLADLVAVVTVDQGIAPQHQRVAAAFGKEAALERGVFDVGQWVDEGTQFVVDGDVQLVSSCCCGNELSRRPACYTIPAAGPMDEHRKMRPPMNIGIPIPSLTFLISCIVVSHANLIKKVCTDY